MKDFRWLGALCLGLFLLYLPTLGQGFHFDDHHMVVENQLIKRWEHLPKMVMTPSISSVPVAKGMYRPVLMASYAWNYWTGRLNPVGYHLVNVWLHLLVVCFAVALAMRLWPEVSPVWGTLGVALWAAHPLQTQAVAYVASRSSVLATFWMVLALWGYLVAIMRGQSPSGQGQSPSGQGQSPSALLSKGAPSGTVPRGTVPRGTVPRGTVPRGIVPLAASLLAYGLALGSKEIAVTLPGLLLLIEWRLRQLTIDDRRSTIDPRVLRLAPFLLLTVGYLLWRKHLIGAVGVVYPLRPWAENVRMQLEGILTYLRLFCWPVNQSIVHPQPTGEGIWPWVSLGMLAVLAWAGWRGRKRMPGLTFALAWAAVTFLPIAVASSLNLVVSEHHAYLPTLGFALGLPAILQALANFRFSIFDLRFKSAIRNPQSAIIVVCFLLLGVLSVATVRRNLIWGDNFTLWKEAVAKAPNSCMSWNNLGLEYEGRQELEDALVCYLRALQMARGPYEEATARTNLGNWYVAVNQPELALEEFRRCIRLNPFEAAGNYNNVGMAHCVLGSLEKAEETFTRALEADPRLIPAYLNLGSLWFRQGNRAQGGLLFERAAQLDPDHPTACLVLGKFYISQGQFDRAWPVFQRLVTLTPRRPEGHLYAAISGLRMEPPRREEAHKSMARAVALGWEQDPILLAELDQLRGFVAE